MRMSASAMLLAGLMITASAQAEPPQMRVRPAETPTPTPSPGDTYGLPGAPTERALRARANLEALLAGRIYTNDLSPQDLQDVLDFERMVRGAYPDNRTFQQQCIDEEIRRNGGNPTRLAWQVIRLKCQ